MDFKVCLTYLKDKIYPKLLNLIKLINHFKPEICIIVGLGFIIKATYIVSFIAGLYLTGIVILLIGLFLAKGRK